MNGQTQPAIQGFMIPLNQADFNNILSSPTRSICSSASQAALGAPWYACENIQLTGTVDAVTARVGDTVTIQVGIQALPTEFGQHLILSAQAWVCYPNTVAGGADASLVVSSMQTTFPSFIYSGPLSSAPCPPT